MRRIVQLLLACALLFGALALTLTLPLGRVTATGSDAFVLEPSAYEGSLPTAVFGPSLAIHDAASAGQPSPIPTVSGGPSPILEEGENTISITSNGAANITATQAETLTDTENHYYVDDDGNNETGDGSQANPWKTISYALTQVSGLDTTIHVAPGTYDTVMGGGWAEVFPINMKEGISLVGAGADVTILDASQSAAVIKAENIGEGERITGFTIRNGYWPGSDHGGGLYISGSSPVVEDNIITNNDAGASGNAYHSGGGIYVENGSPTIRNNTITNNGSTKLTGDCGGGIYVTGATSAPLIQGNTISNNTVWIGGAGIYVESSSTLSTIEANLITDNNQVSAQWVDHQESAGGIALHDSLATVRNNIIVGNIHTGLNLYGSASSSAYVVNNTIVGNTWHGISLYSASPTIANNLLVGNGNYGINEENTSADPAVSYNLFHDNGSGVYLDEGESPHLNTTTLNGLVEEAHDNLDGAPAFVDQSSGDYHLTTGSPAVDAGDTSAPRLPYTDFDGDPRIMNGVVDIGADEYYAPVVPPTEVTISGPTTSTVNTAYVFTATVNPLTATQPITYVWQATGQSPVTHKGGRSDMVGFAWSTSGSQVITVTATNAGGSVDANHAITIAGSPTGSDAYEPDDTCAQASELATDGTAQQHTFHQYADTDWARFTVVSSTTYVVQATSTSAGADLMLELYDACGGDLEGSDDNAFGADARIIFTAPSNGTYYVKALNHDPAVYGPDVTYELSIRAQSPVPIVVIVAGRNEANQLEANITFMGDQAYRTFRRAGVPRENIRYLSVGLDRDADQDGHLDVDGVPTWENVRYAVRDWPGERGLTLGKPFYLYLADHGGTDYYCALGCASGSWVRAEDLDLWLSDLEASTGVGEVSVILEACYSGSFIDVTTYGPAEISDPGRVVIASTGSGRRAFPSERGGYFSDAFFTALGNNANLWTAHVAGRTAARAAWSEQTPWLDDNGDAVADGSDGQVARGRGLVAEGGGAIPVVDWLAVGEVSESGVATITAQIRDDVAVVTATVEVYPPGLRVPDTGEGETPVLPVDRLGLRDDDDDGVYEGVYAGFVEEGLYRLVAYAWDNDWNLSLPHETTVGEAKVYLPLVLR